MFDFQQLNVYKKARTLNRTLHSIAKETKLERHLADQLKRASLSIVLNIAEGTGKFSKADKRNFYTVARGSIYECVAILEVLEDLSIVAQGERVVMDELESVSKMLLGLIKSTY